MRRSGRTTRLIDAYVQELFTKGEVVVLDHWCWWFGKEDIESVYKANMHIFHRFMDRMMVDHQGIELEVDKKKVTVKLKR
jgi:hypothetical protein